VAELKIPTIEEMRDQFLDDIELGAIDEGIDSPPIQPGTDWYALATAVANLDSIALENLALAAADSTPVTATGQGLDNWRITFGLPEAPPTPGAGKIRVETLGSASIADGEQLTHATGVRYRVVGSWVGVQNNDEIDVEATENGSKTNRAAGERLEFVNPPSNVRRVAYVALSQPVTGGTDSEDPERKRARILNATATQPAGGNWGDLRRIALDASPAVQGAYVYPALGGPGSVKVAVCRGYDRVTGSYSREPSDTVLRLVRNAIHASVADGVETVVQSVANQQCSLALTVSIPSAVSSGGNGTGWLDGTPWPALSGGDTSVSVTAVTNSRTFTVGASTATSPVAGQTHIAWWSTSDSKFHVRLITAVSGSSGAWVLTVDQPLSASSDGSIVAVGDCISPASANSVAYGETWLSIFEQLGPGENTADSNRLPRAARHPYTTTGDAPNLTGAQKKTFMNAHDEVLDVEYSLRSPASPSVPSTVADRPNVLVLGKLGIYPQ
jgi:uncharacterized phage protein gp47/JayE